MTVSWCYVLILLNSENKNLFIQLPDIHLLKSECGGQSRAPQPALVCRLHDSRPGEEGGDMWGASQAGCPHAALPPSHPEFPGLAKQESATNNRRVYYQVAA